KEFDWFSYNLLISERIFDKQDRKAIAIDPSYISKSGKRTPWIGYFWSGCAGVVKRGLEIMGIGLINIDKHDCMMLRAVQSPDTLTLANRGATLNDWYLKVIEQYKEQLLSISKYIVADAYFSKFSFTQGLHDLGFHLVSRLR
ncbi:transposase, partial [Dysgonomonas sp. 521]|nr:transposase [Dysgonomonas sp. 521]